MNKPTRWITINGNHVPIFSDVHKFEFGKDDYSSMHDYIESIQSANRDANEETDPEYVNFNKDKSTEKFVEETGISVDERIKNKCHPTSLQMMYDTISELKKEYGFDNIYSMEEAPEDATYPCAMGPNGTLLVNTKLWKYSKQVMDQYYQHTVDEGVHPKGDSSSIIAHEVAHALVSKKISESIKSQGLQRKIEYDQVYTVLMNNMHHSENIANRNTAYKEFSDKIQKALTYGKPQDIGSYATNDYHELASESFADVYYNGDEANEISKHIYRIFF